MNHHETTWSIEYDQSGLNDLWVYKFDNEPIRDGRWHLLNGASRASYRIVQEHIQVVCPKCDVDDETWNSLLTELALIGPLNINGALEISIQREASGLSISDWSIDDRVPLKALTADDLYAACKTLSEKDSWDE